MKEMETTSAIYLRRPTEDDGKSVAPEEQQLRTKADQLGGKIISNYHQEHTRNYS
jgi:hypothetical protein